MNRQLRVASDVALMCGAQLMWLLVTIIAVFAVFADGFGYGLPTGIVNKTTLRAFFMVARAIMSY